MAGRKFIAGGTAVRLARMDWAQERQIFRSSTLAEHHETRTSGGWRNAPRPWTAAWTPGDSDEIVSGLNQRPINFHQLSPTFDPGSRKVESSPTRRAEKGFPLGNQHAARFRRRGCWRASLPQPLRERCRSRARSGGINGSVEHDASSEVALLARLPARIAKMSCCRGVRGIGVIPGPTTRRASRRIPADAR